MHTTAEVDLSVLTASSSKAANHILDIIRAQTGMGLVGMAWVRADVWRACAVIDAIGLGLKAGDELDVDSTLCKDVMESRVGIAFDDAHSHPVFRDHKTPKIYGFRAYISEPIFLSDGTYFGNLFGLDPEPKAITSEKCRAIFTACAGILGKLLEDQLRAQQQTNAIEEYQLTGEAREVFLAVVAHDLRNPLQAMNMAAQLLSRGAEPKTIKVAERLLASARRMGKLIDDLVDYAKGRAGTSISIDREPTDDLASALEAVIAEFEEAQPRHRFDSSFAFEGTLLLDVPRIQQLLSNLIGNAVSYGAPDFPITVEGFTDRDDVVITVNNLGPLVADDVLAQMFDAHYQGPRSVGTSMGLGLSICKQIAAAHGGKLTVQSLSEGGTTFTLRLPARSSSR